jgi:hypothetical protein
MKIYLINPRLPLSFVSNEYAAPLALKKYSTPPLGLLTAAGMIPDRHQVRLCDENAGTIDWNADCDIVGLTGMHLQEPRIREIAARFRALGKTVILGGPSVRSPTSASSAKPRPSGPSASPISRGEHRKRSIAPPRPSISPRRRCRASSSSRRVIT